MSFDNDPNLFFLFPAVSGEASCVVVLALLVGSIDYDKLFRYGFQANCWISHACRNDILVCLRSEEFDTEASTYTTYAMRDRGGQTEFDQHFSV